MADGNRISAEDLPARTVTTKCDYNPFDALCIPPSLLLTKSKIGIAFRTAYRNGVPGYEQWRVNNARDYLLDVVAEGYQGYIGLVRQWFRVSKFYTNQPNVTSFDPFGALGLFPSMVAKDAIDRAFEEALRPYFEATLTPELEYLARIESARNYLIPFATYEFQKYKDLVRTWEYNPFTTLGVAPSILTEKDIKEAFSIAFQQCYGEDSTYEPLRHIRMECARDYFELFATGYYENKEYKDLVDKWSVVPCPHGGIQFGPSAINTSRPLMLAICFEPQSNSVILEGGEEEEEEEEETHSPGLASSVRSNTSHISSPCDTETLAFEELLTPSPGPASPIATVDSASQALSPREHPRCEPCPAGLASTQRTNNIKALELLPKKRRAGLRPGKILNTSRSINMEAYFGQKCGEPPLSACRHCKDSFGPFQECVIVTNFFRGSCCNCHYNGDGYRCSFRQKMANKDTPTPTISVDGAFISRRRRSCGTTRSGLKKTPSSAARSRTSTRASGGPGVGGVRRARSPASQLRAETGAYRELTRQQRRAERARLHISLAALATVSEDEGEDEEIQYE